MIVQPVVKPMEHYTALVITRTRGHVPHNLGGEEVLPAAGEDVRGGVQAVAPHRGLHGPELVSPCASVRGLGVRGVGAVTTLCPGLAGPRTQPRVCCNLGGLQQSRARPAQPAQPSPAQSCRLQTGWTTSLIFLLPLYSPAQPRLEEHLCCMCCMCGVTPISAISTYLLWRCHVSRVTLCGCVTQRDQCAMLRGEE